MTPKPTLHPEFAMGSYVTINDGHHSTMHGVVSGVAQVGVIFNYIIILDNPIETEFGVVEAVSIPGVALKMVE